MTTYNESRNTEMKSKLEQIIEHGRERAVGVIEKIQAEVPVDRIVKAKVIDFEPDEHGIWVQIPDNGHGSGHGDGPARGPARERLHKNANSQMMERAGLASDFMDRLQGETNPLWRNELLAHNLRTVFRHQNETRYLTRSYKGELRGFLSNKYRRLDSRPIIEALASAAQQIGAVPVDGIGTDTRVSLKILLPRVFEIPMGGGRVDYVAWGYSWQNSDYGNGAHTMLEFLMRLVCANGATGEETLRQVHLGGRLQDDEIWSARTYKLDTDRSASMIKDAVQNYLSPAKLNEKIAMLAKAAEAKVDLDNKTIGEWLKKQLGVGRAKEVVETYNSADVENLPPGNSMWRLSNAISWLAGKEQDGEKRLELMAAAGAILKKAA